jgi:outer membrane lipase/esterase
MPRIRLLTSALALAICSITAAQAQQFSGVISFGDSLSDAGNIAQLKGLPPGNSFTTNPDPVTVQIIASAFGFNQTNSAAGGTNFAVGGACVEANSATFQCIPSAQIPFDVSITGQVNGYLAAGGKADPNALYTMWGGANDLFTYADLAGAGVIKSDQALAGVANAASTETGLIDSLQTAGARNIIVFNLPNIALTPDAAAEATAAAKAEAAFVLAHGGTPAQAQAAGAQAAQSVITALTGLSIQFNGTLNQGMSGKTGIIPVDVFGLVNEVFKNPGTYGFSNVTGMACATGPGVGGTPSSVACGPASEAGKIPYTYLPGTNMSYFFADDVHPTGAGHALLAAAVLSEIQAPSYISMLGEVPLHVFDTTTNAVHDQMEADMSGQRADGTLRSFASFDYSRQRYDATMTSPNTTSDDETLVMGSDYYVNSAISLGLSTTFSHQNASFGGGGGFRNNEPLVSAFGMWHSPEFYVSVMGAVGMLDFTDIQRVIDLGPAVRSESGSTDGSQLAYQLEGGYYFLFDDVKTGPYASVVNQRVHVGSYQENGGDSTTMTFGSQVRDSLISSIGWQLSGDSKMFNGSIHPFARVAYEHESDTSARNVTAGLAALNGSFSMPGYQPDTSWWAGQVGVSAQVGSNISGYLSYNGQFGSTTERVQSINLGMKWTW